MNNERMQQIERWAEYVRAHPQEWKKHHTKFINALFEKHNTVIKSIKALPNGKEKLEALYGNK